MFPVLFAISGVLRAGWRSGFELPWDKDQKIARPRQIYLGQRTRDYVPMEQRKTAGSAAGIA